MSYTDKIARVVVRLGNKFLQRYMRLRIRPTKAEMRSYNTTDRILLTFDDFGTKEQVVGILDVLRQERVKAVFFLIGEWSQKNPALVAQIRGDGHWIGNHTHSHPNLKTLDEAAIRKEILGGPRAELLRPPQGSYNNRVRKIAATMGYEIAFWSIDTKDWAGLSAERIQQRVWDELHAGACILLHINGAHTLEALPGLIAGIRSRGYELCNTGVEIRTAGRR